MHFTGGAIGLVEQDRLVALEPDADDLQLPDASFDVVFLSARTAVLS